MSTNEKGMCSVSRRVFLRQTLALVTEDPHTFNLDFPVSFLRTESPKKIEAIDRSQPPPLAGFFCFSSSPNINPNYFSDFHLLFPTNNAKVPTVSMFLIWARSVLARSHFHRLSEKAKQRVAIWCHGVWWAGFHSSSILHVCIQA